MKTFNQAILDLFEILEQEAKMTVQEIVLMEDCNSKCLKTKTGFSIRSGKTSYGRGKTREQAWEKAALEILGFKITEQ